MAPDRPSLEERLRDAFASEAQEHPLRSDFAASISAALPEPAAGRGPMAAPAVWRALGGLAIAVVVIAAAIGLSRLPSVGPAATGSASPSPSSSANPSSPASASPAIPTQPPAQVTSTWVATTLPSAPQPGQPVGGPGGGVSALPGGGFIDFVVNGPERTYVFTSPDGMTWTQRGTVTGFDALGITGPVATNGRVYVALGDEGGGTNYGPQRNGAAWVSTDLVRWTKVPVQDAFAGVTFSSLAGASQGFVAVGQVQATGNAAWFSPDGLHWSVLTDAQGLPKDTAMPLDVTHTDAGFVMVGKNGDRAAAWTSPDGRHWTQQGPLPGGTGVTLEHLAVDGNGLLGLAVVAPGIQVGPGDFREPVAPWTSNDGVTWQAHPASPALLGATISLVAAPGGFVAAGAVGAEPGLWTSTDGMTWTPVAGVDLGGLDLSGVVSDGRHVLLIGSGGSALALAGNGIHAPRAAPPPSPLSSDVPGADATVPPRVSVVSGLRIQDLAGLWTSLGLTCQSWAGGQPGTAGGYALHCERHDASTSVDVVAEAFYWTSDGVHSISASITSANGEAIDGATPARQLFLPSVALVAGDAARSWAQDRVGAAACTGGCTQSFAGSQLTVTTGLGGSQQLDVVARPAG